MNAEVPPVFAGTAKTHASRKKPRLNEYKVKHAIVNLISKEGFFCFSLLMFKP